MKESSKQKWNQLASELSNRISHSVQIRITDSIDRELYEMFKDVEQDAFRFELRYTYDELDHRMNMPESLLLFATSNDRPIGVILVYRLAEIEQRTLYLDTIAVRLKRLGLGSLMLDSVIEYAKNEEFSQIILDTEEEDENGVDLLEFYTKHGFSLVQRSPTGNITLQKSIEPQSS